MLDTIIEEEEVSSSSQQYITRDEKMRLRLEKFLRTNHDVQNVHQYKLSKILAQVELTDAGNALRFFARYGYQFHFVKESNTWLQWNGRIWITDEIFSIMDYAKMVTAYIDMEADCIPPPVDENGEPLIMPLIGLLDSPTHEQKEIIKKFEEHERHVETLRKWARGSRSRRSLEAMVELLKAERGVTLLKRQFDADNMLINCQNGILDLRTMELRPHDKDALCTLITTVNVVPGATRPAWESFVQRVMLDRQPLVKFLQQIAGMGLTGERYEDVFPVCHGSGENGKTVYQEVLREILGTYADVATDAMFLERKNENDRFESAALDGIRLLFKDETKQGGILDEGKVKAMTGGGAIKGEIKYGKIFTFIPKFTSILSTNHKPRISGNDHGIWRRVKLIPWDYSFENVPDKKSKPEVFAELRKEHEGIFMWMCDGLQALLTNGYTEPDEVKIATKEYRDSSDIIGFFLEEKCIVGKEKDYWVTLQFLYNVYSNYMENESGNKPFSKANFSELMQERGFEKTKSGEKGWYWKGLRLRREDEPYQVKPEPEKKPEKDSTLKSVCGICEAINWKQGVTSLNDNECLTCLSIKEFLARTDITLKLEDDGSIAVGGIASDEEIDAAIEFVNRYHKVIRPYVTEKVSSATELLASRHGAFRECPDTSCEQCHGLHWQRDQAQLFRCEKCYPAYFVRKDQM